MKYHVAKASLTIGSAVALAGVLTAGKKWV
jgi:hypothetical protein